MPGSLVLHERDAFAFDGLCDQCGRLALDGFRFRKRGAHGIKVVAVHIDDMPAECPELLIEGLRSDDIGGLAVDLQTVDINDRTEIVTLVMGGCHCGLPDFAFFAFSVADQAVDAVILAGKLIGKRHAVRRRKALAKGTGGHVDARQVVHIRMTLKPAVELAEGKQFLFRQNAFLRKNRIEQGRSMTFGKNKAVALRRCEILPYCIFRCDIHDFKEQQGQNIRCAEGSARMPAFRIGDLTNDVPPDIPCVKFQFFIVHNCFYLIIGSECLRELQPDDFPIDFNPKRGRKEVRIVLRKENSMKYDFTTVIDRHGKDSIAVDPPAWYNLNVPTKEGFSRIPMWVADMSFATCPAITNAMAERISHPCFGYFAPTDEYYDAIIRWQKDRNGTEVKPSEIGYENGVLGGVVSALNVLCSSGDYVLFHSPVYIGFSNTVGENGYHMVFSDLQRDEEGIWRMDLADMERKIVKHHIHTAVFCNPHNPCGRVWEPEEIKAMMDLFEKYEVWVVSDEIWSDLILNDHHHTPTYSVSEYARTHTVSMYAPSKTFSLAGLIGSYHICFNPWLHDRMRKESSNTHYNLMNVLWMHALIGAYSKEGEEWLAELKQVLSDNVNYACDYIRTHFKGVTLAKPEGTYMLFLNCEEWCKEHHTDIEALEKKGVAYGVLWQDGRPFHSEYAIRMNLAVPHSMVIDAFDRLDRYVFNAEDAG